MEFGLMQVGSFFFQTIECVESSRREVFVKSSTGILYSEKYVDFSYPEASFFSSDSRTCRLMPFISAIGMFMSSSTFMSVA